MGLFGFGSSNTGTVIRDVVDSKGVLASMSLAEAGSVDGLRVPNIDKRSVSITTNTILQMSQYPTFEDNLTRIEAPITFDKVIDAAARTMSRKEQKYAYKALEHGVGIIEDDDRLNKYLVAYGQMHEAKLKHFFKDLNLADGCEMQIVDWGCGQGLATATFLDCFRGRYDISSIRLLEVSNAARKRAFEIIGNYNVTGDLKRIKWEVDKKLCPNDFQLKDGIVTLHLFSNILDVDDIDFANIVEVLQKLKKQSPSYVVAVCPSNNGSCRIDLLLKLLDIRDVVAEVCRLQFDNSYTEKIECSCCGAIAQFGLPISESRNPSSKPEIDIVYGEKDGLVTEVFDIGGCSDVIFSRRQEIPSHWLKYELSSFENQLCYNYIKNNVPSYLSVLNNIVARGAPTRTGVLIEEYLSSELKLSHRIQDDSVIEYEMLPNTPTFEVEKLFDEVNASDKLQRMVAIPLLVSRIQHAVLRGAMASLYDINKEVISVLVCEHDFKCTKLALEELSLMLENIVSFMDEAVVVPKFEVIEFAEVAVKTHDKTFDVFLDVAFDEGKGCVNQFDTLKDRFKYGAQIRGVGVNVKANNFQLVTGANIKYKPLCEKQSDGRFKAIEENAKHLRFFLQNIFRKTNFRPGQLPILNRALQSKSVIGLLPTGGGKSLTYQLAGMMQPGMVFVVDPIKSLMKDQVDGLIKNGITTCIYFNSSLTDPERELAREKMVNGNCKFLFVSPERLSIPSFRWDLREMYENQLYFSYAVVDEVHCVSEWGHDFRFTYLHLGRNLHKHVRCKGDALVPLFGLTATASFDVLADVERELSGAYAYQFDPDVVVRYENTNRLELQYRIFRVNNARDRELKKNEMSANLRRNIIYNNKLEKIQDVLRSNYKCFRELNKESSISTIKQRFLERENIASDSEYGQAILHCDIEQMLDEESWITKPFNSAGLIFCPHKGFKKSLNGGYTRSTAISVQRVYESLSQAYTGGVVRYFSGSIENDDGSYDKLTKDNQEDFINNQAGLMVATKAFGLGIDKPNIRFVIEINHPSSLESFVQEAGRAGRDRKMALATLMLSEADDVDEDVVTFFHENNFRGELNEKIELRRLFGKIKMLILDESADTDNAIILPGFLEKLLSISPGSRLRVTIPYQQDENNIINRQALIDKLVYRLSCIGVVCDIECKYKPQGSLRDLCLTMVRLEDGGYYNKLKQFLLRYFNETRAEQEMKKVKDHKGENEIHKCIGYLTEFVYNNIEKKRKRAIDDIHRFCRYGVDQERNGKSWLEVNEDLKDYIYFYFNSKYAREGYVVNGEKFSLLEDASPTSEMAPFELIQKYLRVVEDDQLEASSPKDNIKHLQGAIRLISRGLIEVNPALSILNVFCLAFLGLQKSESLKKEALQCVLNEGFYLLYKRGGIDKLHLFEKLHWFQDELRHRTDVDDEFLGRIVNQTRKALLAEYAKEIINHFTQGGK